MFEYIMQQFDSYASVCNLGYRSRRSQGDFAWPCTARKVFALSNTCLYLNTQTFPVHFFIMIRLLIYSRWTIPWPEHIKVRDMYEYMAEYFSRSNVGSGIPFSRLPLQCLRWQLYMKVPAITLMKNVQTNQGNNSFDIALRINLTKQHFLVKWIKIVRSQYISKCTTVINNNKLFTG